MRRAYRTGLVVAMANWPLVAVVFLVSFVGGLAFMACAWVALANALGGSLATRTLLTSLDLNVFVDIFAHHRDTVRSLLAIGVALAGGLSFVWIWIHAGIVTAVAGRHSTLRDSLSAGAGRFWTFTRLWLFATVTQAIVLVAAYMAWQGASSALADSADEMTWYWALAGCALVTALVLVAVTTVHDHARIRCVETGDGAGRCMVWAWGYVLREWRTFILSWLLIVTLVIAWMPYQAVAEVIPATSALGLTASFLWAQIFMAFRALLRVWAFASVACLQARAEEV